MQQQQQQVNDMSESFQSRMRDNSSKKLQFPNQIGNSSDNDGTFEQF
jgi:hypothetical protein